MKLFNELILKFNCPDCSKNPKLGLIDEILEKNPSLLSFLSSDVTSGCSDSHFGRKDTPTVKHVVRAAIYKEFKSMTYRELEYAQSYSRICTTFIKIDDRKPFSFKYGKSIYQKSKWILCKEH